MKTLLLALLIPALGAGTALAAEFNHVQLDKSSVSFVSKQMGVPVEGRFKTFAARITLDTAKPETGKAQIDIELASIDAGSSDANDEAKGKAWFNIREFPGARFVSSGIRSTGNGRYEATGKMTIKGRTRDVVAPFSARTDGGNLLIEGAIPILRLQYGIGDGTWTDTGIVADEVQVRFRFTLAAKK